MQVGHVRLRRFAGVSNGGGPKSHVINGKDHGGTFEFTESERTFNRMRTPLGEMIGLSEALVVVRNNKARIPDISDSEDWPSDRGIRGIITGQAHMSLDKVTFVGFGANQSALALEPCGKCKVFQGGFHTFTSNLTFIQNGCVLSVTFECA
jgi:hypothetical protein